tara:strand:+ start:475 stop:636 length:162 start_codon:yes stop_codon:yes gene_type:complete
MGSALTVCAKEINSSNNNQNNNPNISAKVHPTITTESNMKSDENKDIVDRNDT